MTDSGSAFRLAIDVSEAEGGHTLTLRGELDLSTADHLVQAGADLLRPPGARLTIDMSGVEFCDSAGISGLVRLRNLCAEKGSAFDMINLSDGLRRVIADLSGLGSFLGVEKPSRGVVQPSQRRGEPSQSVGEPSQSMGEPSQGA